MNNLLTPMYIIFTPINNLLTPTSLHAQFSGMVLKEFPSQQARFKHAVKNAFQDLVNERDEGAEKAASKGTICELRCTLIGLLGVWRRRRRGPYPIKVFSVQYFNVQYFSVSADVTYNFHDTELSSFILKPFKRHLNAI